MGMKRDPNAKRKPMRKVSRKQIKRLRSLRAKKQMALNAQHEQKGGTYCMAWKFGIRGIDPVGCHGSLEWDHVRPKGRHGVDTDTFANAQIICQAHHRYKTITPGMYDHDFRSAEDKRFMADLDGL